MFALCLLAWATWLSLAPTASPQFNSTIDFTLTSMDAMMDLDDIVAPFSYDEETGYRTADVPYFMRGYCEFIGTGFRVNGFGTYKNESQPTPVASGWLHRPDRKVVVRTRHDDDAIFPPGEMPRYNGSEEGAPNHFNDSYLELGLYLLLLNVYPTALYEFHNLTVTIPIRTQACVVNLMCTVLC